MKRLSAALIVFVLLSATALALTISASDNPTKAITATTARIDWTTNVAATSRIDYGTTTALGLVKEDLAFVTSHSVTLSGLETGKKYYYRITSIAADGDFAINDNDGNFYSFTTGAGAETVPPAFSDVKPSSFGDTTTTLSWKTNEPATTVVYFGETSLQAVTDTALVSEHVLTVPTQQGRTYTVIVSGCDAFGNCANATPLTVLAGAQNGLPPLTADVPRFVNENRVTVRGTTRPFAKIEIFSDGVKRHTLTAAGDGSFVAANVLLSAAETTIKIVVTDVLGNAISQEYPITIDNVPPKVTIQALPAVAPGTPLTVSGMTDEPVTILYEVKRAFDTEAPDRVSGLAVASVKANEVVLKWNPSEADDVFEYAVYRDGVRVGVAQAASFVDSTNAKSTYEYRVSAVDKSCNEGALSESVLVQTPSGSTVEGSPKEVDLACASDAQSVEADGAFSFAVDLAEGDNQLKISAADKANNRQDFLKTVRLDHTPPQFIETNLDKISPTYIPEVTVSGKVSEKATVFVYVNDETEPQTFEVTDDDGRFSIKVLIKTARAKASNASMPTGAVVLEAGVGKVVSKVRLEAIDAAGLKATAGPTDVVFALCGEGSWFDVDVGDASPSIITPRLLIDGVQQIGIPVNISYRGNASKNNVLIKRVSVSALELNLEDQENSDNGLAQVNYLKNPRNVNEGYIQIAFGAQAPDSGQTTAEKETEIYEDHETACATGGSCVKLYYQLNIEFQEVRKNVGAQTQATATQSEVVPENLRQKSCLPIEIQIDKPLHQSDYIPNKYLVKSSALFADAIDVIDRILKPLTVVGEYTVYACFAMNAVQFGLQVSELFECDVKNFLGAFGGSGGEFKREVAEIGKCDEIYPAGKEAGKNDQCNECQSAIKRRLDLVDAMREVCDRVSCPSAPTLQTYIAEKKGSVKDTGFTDKNGMPYFSGSSCGFSDTVASTSVTPDSIGASTAPKVSNKLTVSTDYAGVKEQYLNYVKHKDDDDSTAQAGTVNCEGPHPASPECCGFEYNEEWDSACGIPAAGDGLSFALDSFSEIEESGCYAAKKANEIPDFEQAARQAGQSVSCGGIVNALSGICSTDPLRAEPEYIGTNIHYTDLDRNLIQDGEVVVVIEGYPTSDPKEYRVLRGYARRDYTPGETKKTDGGVRKINTEAIIQLDGKDFTDVFRDYQPSQKQARLTTFKSQFCTNTGSANLINVQECNARVNGVFDQIVARITTGDKQYIVKPDDEGILRSVQCFCLPAVAGYLQHWRTVLGHVKTCVDHARITGEGASGACKKVYSTMICDVIYDVLRCFVKAFSGPGAGSSTGRDGSVLDVLTIFSEAGKRTQGNIQSRYGNTALWQTMFSENNLVHGACMFAFTGEWDIGLGGLFQQTVTDIPLESTGLVWPAERRYVAYTPTTQPKGLTSWIYHVGVDFIAGADVDYSLKLRCSNSRKCLPEDGYEGVLGRVSGACDCYNSAEQEVFVDHPDLGTGTLNKNGEIAADVYYTVQAESPESAVRYDTAVFTYEYKDSTGATQVKTIETPIHLVGADAPNFCSLKLLGSPVFSCTFGGDYVGAQFKSDPKLTDPQVILLNKPAKFDVKVDIFGNVDPRQQGGFSAGQNTKYLTYEVRNGNGILVDTNKPQNSQDVREPITLDGTGEIPQTVVTKTVAQEWFGGATAPVFANAFSFIDANKPSTQGANIYAKSWINPTSTFITTQPGADKLLELLFVFTDDAGSYMVYKSSGIPLDHYVAKDAATEKTGAWGYFQKNRVLSGDATITPLMVGGVAVTGKVSGKSLAYADTQGPAPSGAVFTLVFLDKIPAKNAELYVRYQSGDAPACSRFVTVPDFWKVKFSLWDSKKSQFGAFYVPNYDQPAMDAQGNVQTKEITVEAFCAKDYVGGSTDGWPQGVPKCNDDGSKANANACVCDTLEHVKELAARGEANPNCGSSAPAGKYCAYTSSGGRACSVTPAPALTVSYGGTQVASGSTILAQTSGAITTATDVAAKHSLILLSMVPPISGSVIPIVLASGAAETSHAFPLADIPQGAYVLTAQATSTATNVNYFSLAIGAQAAPPTVGGVTFFSLDGVVPDVSPSGVPLSVFLAAGEPYGLSVATSFDGAHKITFRPDPSLDAFVASVASGSYETEVVGDGMGSSLGLPSGTYEAMLTVSSVANPAVKTDVPFLIVVG